MQVPTPVLGNVPVMCAKCPIKQDETYVGLTSPLCKNDSTGIQEWVLSIAQHRGYVTQVQKHCKTDQEDG